MSKKLVLPLIVAILALPSIPARVDAYGAAHVGYTHVGDTGVYHTSDTAVHASGGAYAGGKTTTATYGGGAYKTRADEGTGGYHYSATYHGGATADSAHYAYVR